MKRVYFDKPRIFYGLLPILLLIIAVTASCGGGGYGGGGAPPDTTAPVTTANPGSGTYGSVQNVTLTSNESSIVYYSLDGADPSVGGSNTISGTSPISGVSIGAGTIVLKFFAIDATGNREAVKTETYVIDLVSPTVSLVSAAPDPFGLLTTRTISWQSNEAGIYAVELGGTGTLGSGTTLALGSITANTPVDQVMNGYQLSFSAATPLWIYVTDAVGHTGSTSVSLSMKPLVAIPIGGVLSKIVILPGGQKAYIARTSDNVVAVVDTDPLSASYNTVLTTVSVGIRPNGIAIVPDGTRAYVTNSGETISDIDTLSVISTATDAEIATTPLGSQTAPGGIAITMDGKRGYFTSFENKIYIVDTDPGSLTYNLVVDYIPRVLLLSGNIAMTPNGKKAVVNWAGIIAHAVDVIDVDPTSPTYNTVIASPVPIVPGVSGDVAVSPDSAFAYATNGEGQLCKIDLQMYTLPLCYAGVFFAQGSIALTPDGSTALHSNFNSKKLYVIKTSDLTSITEVDLGAELGNSIAITPDGSRAYVERSVLSASSELVMVPLQ